MNWFLLLNFDGGPGVPFLNFELEPGSLVPGFRGPGFVFPLLYHAKLMVSLTFYLYEYENVHFRIDFLFEKFHIHSYYNY